MPPDDTQRSLWTVPAGIIEPSTYPDIIGGDGGSNNIIIWNKYKIEDYRLLLSVHYSNIVI